MGLGGGLSTPVAKLRAAGLYSPLALTAQAYDSFCLSHASFDPEFSAVGRGRNRGPETSKHGDGARKRS